MRLILTLSFYALLAAGLRGNTHYPVVADSLTHQPLGSVSVFGSNGKFIGTSDAGGRVSCVSPSDYPLTVRLMGFKENVVKDAGVDTLLLAENITWLDEVVVEGKEHRMLHILAYVREYSSLTTYTDTVTMFREKMIDFMLPTDRKTKYRGWRFPRVLNSKSYYRFTDAQGLDSVSDRCNHHFTWSDWVGITPPTAIPMKLRGRINVADTIRGKYSPAEIWTRNDDRISVDINVLADTTCRRWVPNIAAFYNFDVDFEELRLRLNYADVAGDSVVPIDLTGFSFNVESRGRGHVMFKFNRPDEPYYVTTYTEVYILDKEFVTVKEAKKWEKKRPAAAELEIYQSADAPELDSATWRLIARVEAIDHDATRQGIAADHRLAGGPRKRLNFAAAALQRVKGLFGIDELMAKRKRNKQWREFRKTRVKINRPVIEKEDSVAVTENEEEK